MLYSGKSQTDFLHQRRRIKLSNTLGLTLLGIFIGSIIVFVIMVQYVANHYPDTKIGQICKMLDEFIERLPGE